MRDDGELTGMGSLVRPQGPWSIAPPVWGLEPPLTKTTLLYLDGRALLGSERGGGLTQLGVFFVQSDLRPGILLSLLLAQRHPRRLLIC